ncbi:(2Fe-2S)-binding protein [Actinomadura flavalba]|uniref:(2Fe-2S)-binding protein n=1 Tax=Actinomadura flavalba TaxID=1120938 RepID=UPI00037DC7BA|nr:(2Fe-2S)-binding protein [Actinomadura flavalba]
MRATTPDQTARVLTEVAALGPYYALETGPPAPGWRPLPERDPGFVAALIDDYALRLGGGSGPVEHRVAASILFQSIAARLWSPVVASAALGVVPDLAALRWRPGSPHGLRLPAPAGFAYENARQLRDLVVDAHLRPLGEMFRDVGKLADGLVWGNAASALAGTLVARPAAPARGIVGDLLDLEPLRGTGAFTRRGFVRRSCCLYYRVPPGGGLCGDCALLDRPEG